MSPGIVEGPYGCGAWPPVEWPAIEYLWSRLRGQFELPHVLYDADNLNPIFIGSCSSDCDAFAKGIFIGPIPARHRLADHDYCVPSG